VREDAAGDLLAVLAVAEAGRDFLGRCADFDRNGAAEAVPCQCHGEIQEDFLEWQAE